MKTTGRVTWCCVALLLALTSVSAVQRLNSIDDLRKIDFGGSVPQHSLVLLYWFAHTVDIDSYPILLTFDPDEEYGSHHYGNSEDLLVRLPRGYKYYTVGNLYKDTSRPLPRYVVNPPTLSNEGNRDRIIFRVRNQQIDQVYITQHHHNSDNSDYDPDHTYYITTNLLRQIREFSMGGNDQTLLSLRNHFGNNADVSTIMNTWGSLACLVLFLSIVKQTQISFQEQSRRPENRNNYESNENSCSVIDYENSDSDTDYENSDPVNNFTREPQNNRRYLCCCIILLALIFFVIVLIAIITHM